MPLAAADLAQHIMDYWVSTWEKKTDPDTGNEYISMKKSHRELSEGLGDTIVNYIKNNLVVSSPWVAAYIPPTGSPVPDPLLLISYGVALRNGYEKFKGGDTPAAWAEHLNTLLRGAFELALPAAFTPAKHALNPLGTVVVPPASPDYRQNWHMFASSVCLTFIQTFGNPVPYSGVHNPVPLTPFTGMTSGMVLS
jgi:hypothetical protein